MLTLRTIARRCICLAVCGKQLADVNAGHRGGNRAERAAGVGLGLGVPAFQLAQAAGHVDAEDLLLVRRELAGLRRPQEGAEVDRRRAQRTGHAAQKRASRDDVLGRFAGVFALHVRSSVRCQMLNQIASHA